MQSDCKSMSSSETFHSFVQNFSLYSTLQVHVHFARVYYTMLVRLQNITAQEERRQEKKDQQPNLCSNMEFQPCKLMPELVTLLCLPLPFMCWYYIMATAWQMHELQCHPQCTRLIICSYINDVCDGCCHYLPSYNIVVCNVYTIVLLLY